MSAIVAPSLPLHKAAAPPATQTTQSGATGQGGTRRISASRITQLAEDLDNKLNSAIERIRSLNTETKFIAINAKMEAMRVGGDAGKAFGVVAQAVQKVSNQTADVACRLAAETHDTVVELREINEILSTRVRGERLADLAHTSIDLIDRNLYERTCDVRWWATDASVVQACIEPTQSSLAHVSRRMGQILDAYTVYFDIVLTDLEGRIVANGRPHQFPSVGSCHADKTWFRAALACSSGEEFGFRSVSPSNLVKGQRCVIYSCGVREGGQPRGKLVGVLAVVFRWDALGQQIVERSQQSASADGPTRVVITDAEGLILADTERRFAQPLQLHERGRLYSTPRNHAILAEDGQRTLVGHALSPGFETYATGWHAVVIQRLAQ
jgi:hypothetical protein